MKTPVPFVLVELILLLTIPMMGYLGVQTLLDTRAGNFVTPPTATEPGWLAAVEASPVSAIVEVLDGRVTGVALIVQQRSSEPGGVVVLVHPDTVLGGVTVGSTLPADVGPALASELQLAIPIVEILDEERWKLVLGTKTILVNNPDPIGQSGEKDAVEVGEVRIGAGLAAVFAGRQLDGANSDAIAFRRNLWWTALLEDPPAGDDDVSALLQGLGAGIHVLVELPVIRDGVGGPRFVDPDSAEAMIREYVSFPRGDATGDRLSVRVLDHEGGLDLEAVARFVASQGYQIVQIGNAEAFVQASPKVIVPDGVTDERVNELAELFGADIVRPVDSTEMVDVVTLVVGSEALETSKP